MKPPSILDECVAIVFLKTIELLSAEARGPNGVEARKLVWLTLEAYERATQADLYPAGKIFQEIEDKCSWRRDIVQEDHKRSNIYGGQRR